MGTEGWPDAREWRGLLPSLLAKARLGADAPVRIEPLSGGVSSDIVAVTLQSGRMVCAKRALSQLKVAGDWQAPVERNHYEVAYLEAVGEIVPGFVPRVLAEDEAHGIALLDYLPPARFAPWKGELLAGRLDTRVAPALGRRLGAVHAASWGRTDFAREFATDALFDALRLDPYLRVTAERIPDLARPILERLEETAATHLSLVHGDVSPKNILVDRVDGHPVLLDAECAWYGDPAFDAAFLVNHLLLKAMHVPAIRVGLLDAARGFFAAWIAALPGPAQAATEKRVAGLVGCLMLARVDGKSPVEYLDATARAKARSLARGLIVRTPPNVAALIAHFGVGLSA